MTRGLHIGLPKPTPFHISESCQAVIDSWRKCIEVAGLDMGDNLQDSKCIRIDEGYYSVSLIHLAQSHSEQLRAAHPYSEC